MTFRRCSILAASLLMTVSAGAISANAADMAAPATDLWTGFYLGAQAGYLQGSGSNSDLCVSGGGERECLSSIPDDGFDIGDTTTDGITAGGYLGFNYQINSFVLGIEGDFNWDNASGSNNSVFLGLNGFGYDISQNWDASIRARAGFVVDERALLYVTGGPSWLNNQLDFNACGLLESSSNLSGCGDESTEFGWVLGAGAEFMMTDHLSIKAEYLHGWYGNANLDLVKGTSNGVPITEYVKQDLQTNVVRAGVAYHFGGL